MEKLNIEYIETAKLAEDPRNAKEHPESQVRQIVKSIEDFGFNDPIGIGKDNVVIEGHGRLMAAKAMGMEKVPVIRLDHLTDEERVAYMYAHNQLTMTTGYDVPKMEEIFEGLQSFDMADYGFEPYKEEDAKKDFFEMTKEEKEELYDEDSEEYKDLLERQEKKRTTDDCYTPPEIYEVIADWVAKEYGVSRESFRRPFYPGGDYQKEEYKEGDIVVDNPPFSIFSEIVTFFSQNKVPFFLFAPGLTLFSSLKNKDVTAICANATIIYENGVQVKTAFVTNLENEYDARTAPELTRIVNEKTKELRERDFKQQPKYKYPPNVLTGAMMGYLGQYGIDYGVKKGETYVIHELDEQKEKGEGIFGGGMLISEKAAAEKAAAEKAAAEKAAAEKAAAIEWKLSEREKKIIEELGQCLKK